MALFTGRMNNSMGNARVCELEITGNVSTLRCTRFPRNNSQFNNNNQLESNDTDDFINPNISNIGISSVEVSNMMAPTICVRYVESEASIGNGVNAVFFSLISRNNRPCNDNR